MTPSEAVDILVDIPRLNHGTRVLEHFLISLSWLSERLPPMGRDNVHHFPTFLDPNQRFEKIKAANARP